MSDYCPICGAMLFDWRPAHKCSPKWVVWFDDEPDGYYEVDDGEPVYADDAKGAAVVFIELNNGATMTDWSATVIVKAHDKNEWFKVHVEAEVVWSAEYDILSPLRRCRALLAKNAEWRCR